MTTTGIRPGDTHEDEPERASVCSLPEAQQAERAAHIRSRLGPRILRRDELADGFVLHLEPGAALERELRALVDFERGCCGSLDWQVESGAAPPSLRLRVCGEGALGLLALLEGPLGRGSCRAASRGGAER